MLLCVWAASIVALHHHLARHIISFPLQQMLWLFGRSCVVVMLSLALQVLTRGTGSWGMASPASSPNKTGGYMGGSGPPTPEGLQFQHQHSAGSSAATTPAQSGGNSEWDMFFANR